MKLRKIKPIIERLLEFVSPDPFSGCWLWTGAVYASGYAVIGRGRAGTGMRVAHKAAYEHFVGPVPAGMDLDHLCRLRSCVNPAHLEPVTRRENLRRGIGLSAGRFLKSPINTPHTHCLKGHALTPQNSATNGQDGKRRCRLCSNAGQRNLNRQKKSAHRQIYAALKRGQIVRLPCAQCGSTVNIQAHHTDYSKPLDVIWLCPRCHRVHH